MSRKTHFRLNKWEQDRLTEMEESINKTLISKGFPEIKLSEIAHALIKNGIAKYSIKISENGAIELIAKTK